MKITHTHTHTHTHTPHNHHRYFVFILDGDETFACCCTMGKKNKNKSRSRNKNKNLIKKKRNRSSTTSGGSTSGGSISGSSSASSSSASGTSQKQRKPRKHRKSDTHSSSGTGTGTGHPQASAAAASSRSDTSAMRDALLSQCWCVVCLEYRFDQLVLPCQHRVCRGCVSGIVKSQLLMPDTSVMCSFDDMSGVSDVLAHLRVEPMLACPQCKDARVGWTTRSRRTVTCVSSSTLSVLTTLMRRDSSSSSSSSSSPHDLDLDNILAASHASLSVSDVVDVRVSFACIHASCRVVSDSSEAMVRHWQACGRFHAECPFFRHQSDDHPHRLAVGVTACPGGDLDLVGDSTDDSTDDSADERVALARIKARYMDSLDAHLRTGTCVSSDAVSITCALCLESMTMTTYDAHVLRHQSDIVAALCGGGASACSSFTTQSILWLLRSRANHSLLESVPPCDGTQSCRRAHRNTRVSIPLAHGDAPPPPDTSDESDESESDESESESESESDESVESSAEVGF
jgi:hypothetical protein